MPSFTIQFEAQEVEITIPEGLTRERLEKSQKWTEWITQLEKSMSLTKNEGHPFKENEYKLNDIKVISYEQWGSPELQFLRVNANIEYKKLETENNETTRNNAKAPGSLLMRGPSVAVLVVVAAQKPALEAERYVLLTRQPRIPVGSLDFVELPAGMVEERYQEDKTDQKVPRQKEKVFAGGAAKEMEEELGIKIPADEMRNLTELTAQCLSEDNTEGLQNAMYPSAGGCDEYVQIFLYEKEVKGEELEKWKNGKNGGNSDEGENIRSKVVALQDLWKEAFRDGKALAAVALYEGLRREGKLRSIFDLEPQPKAS